MSCRAAFLPFMSLPFSLGGGEARAEQSHASSEPAAWFKRETEPAQCNHGSCAPPTKVQPVQPVGPAQPVHPRGAMQHPRWQ